MISEEELKVGETYYTWFDGLGVIEIIFSDWVEHDISNSDKKYSFTRPDRKTKLYQENLGKVFISKDLAQLDMHLKNRKIVSSRINDLHEKIQYKVKQLEEIDQTLNYYRELYPEEFL